MEADMKNTGLPATSAIAVAAMLGLGAASNAVADLSYTYIEGGYVNVDFDDADADGDGFDIAGSVELTDWFHLFGDYTNADLDRPGPAGDVDFETWEAGAGVNWPLADTVDLVGRLSYLNAEVDVPGFGGGDDDGYGLYGGVRGRITPEVELEGGIAYADFDDAGDDTSLAVAGRYYFTDQWALGLTGDFGDDVTVWGVNLRWELPSSSP
jgi:hypothetical protein